MTSTPSGLLAKETRQIFEGGRADRNTLAGVGLFGFLAAEKIYRAQGLVVEVEIGWGWLVAIGTIRIKVVPIG